MSTPAAKRRRRDAANHALSKPFRSPFKGNLKSPNSSSTNSKSSQRPTSLDSYPSSNATKSTLSKTTNFASDAVTSHRPSSGKPWFHPKTVAVLNYDPEVSSLLKIQRGLEKKLKEYQEKIDTAEQARKIESESRERGFERELDGELTVLIGKWTLASRQAAEELFSKVQDRVNRMGGPRAWKEMEKKRLEDFNNWGQEETNHGDASDDNDVMRDKENRDIYAEYSIDIETDIEKSQRAKGNDEIPDEEDDFNMAMMLTTMNIDLKTIGYDRYQQQWVD